MSMKAKIDAELEMIQFSSEMENVVEDAVNKKKPSFYYVSKVAVLFFAVFMVTGVTAFAARILLNKINVNQDTIPELDPMYAVEAENVGEKTYDSYDPFFDPNDPYDSYDYIRGVLAIDLLDSELAVENPYMNIDLRTDNEDYCRIKVNNYILGDTSNHKLSDEYRGFYSCDPGQEYYSTIQLEVDIILSEEGEQSSWEKDYLGYYKFAESYVSSQGYKVNIIKSTSVEEKELKEGETDIVSEKIAIFVAEGIRYTLKGRTSIETLKGIVDSMK